MSNTLKRSTGIGIITCIGILFTVWVMWGIYTTATSEASLYGVVEIFDTRTQIRQYPARVLASTTAVDSNAAFRTLAGYIFGGNVQKEQIQMTTPVVISQKGNEQLMVFSMPRAYDVYALPAPLDPSVKISIEQPKKIAAIRFGGYATGEKIAHYEKRLRTTLAQQGVVTIGDPFMLIYNDPWTPFFMRRNEVAIEVSYENSYIAK